MSLPDSFHRDVPFKIRERGETYCEEDRISRMSEIDPRTIAATVLGGDPYDVELRRSEGEVTAACSCDFFASGPRLCKHIWAALCFADREGYLEDWLLTDQDRLIADDESEDELQDLPAGQDEDAEEDFRPSGPINERRIQTAVRLPARKADWKQQIGELRQLMLADRETAATSWPEGREIVYVVDVAGTLQGRGLSLEVAYRERRRDGNWSKLKTEGISASTAATLPDPVDREVLAFLLGAQSGSPGYGMPGSQTPKFVLRSGQVAPLLKRMCGTGRCLIRYPDFDGEVRELQWDEAPPWEFRLRVEHVPEDGRYLVRGDFRRGEEALSLTAPTVLVKGGVLIIDDRVAAMNDGGVFEWIHLLRTERELSIPEGQAEELLQQLMDLPRLPELELPAEMRPDQVAPSAKPRLRIEKPRGASAGVSRGRLRAFLSFDYDGLIIPADQAGAGVYQSAERRIVKRDTDAEIAAGALLRSIGFQPPREGGMSAVFELAPTNLPAAVRKLIEQQWHVEAEGKLYRQPGKVQIDVSSGIDWFELHGSADFDGNVVPLPQLLGALRKGEKTIVLGDGTLGVLPEQWLKQYGALAGLGEEEGDALKFARSQIGLLDALLAAQPEATVDEVFASARRRLMEFEGVTAREAPEGFIGVLRPYQREGLGWMSFLRDFSFGGCLADDMGLGKTVQVLALLEERRAMHEAAAQTPGAAAENGHHPQVTPEAAATPPGPSLVVAPRSLIFNWVEEARRFAPKLKVLDHSGIGRGRTAQSLAGYDLILTTYGTLRNDVLMMKEIQFDYVVLDEAQAIKNAQSGSAKAARLVNASHRLALSGTPVQNHLGELWSLFEFLNPGMLGSARAFDYAGGSARVVEQETREVLSRALRPFILRRTKGQVARELPERIEQTIHCEMDAEQRKMYDDLRDHYRHELLERVAREGINKSKIQILEALLRLRQAACHPGLIDPAWLSQGSAKLDALLPQLQEVLDGNHKALVFSQFTSFLSIVRDRLDKESITYEYLDGRTRDRAERVQRFQTDENCKLFLISLKAGGLGLNLTAAEYVFLLDPWWNPAVEAQAIDRAHRIGQLRRVFAYRLICKETVEDKVLQLQATKRELADAIINAENSVISKLGKEELELLLS